MAYITYTKEEADKITDIVLNTVSNISETPIKKIQSNSRAGELNRIRAVYMVICSEIFNDRDKDVKSLAHTTLIGEKVKRHHASVWHHVNIHPDNIRFVHLYRDLYNACEGVCKKMVNETFNPLYMFDTIPQL
jgi:hypothetical protein